MLSPTAGRVAGDAARWLAALPHPVVALDAEGQVVGVNASAASLFGVPVERLLGQELCAAAMPESGCGGFQEVLGMVAGGVPWSGELHLDSAAAVPVVQVSIVPVTEGTAVTGSVLTVDVVGSRHDHALHQSERLNRLARVAAELQNARTLEMLTDVVISHMADAAGATTASLSVVLEDGMLGMLGVRGGVVGAAQRWATFPVDASSPAGEAILTKRPLVLASRAEIERRYPDLELAAPGERSLLCLPLMMGDRAVGVATLSFPHRIDLEGSELEFYRIMADTCAQAVERIRAVQTVGEQHDKLRFLAEASAELASSLDYESTLGNVARLAVPAFADWCMIALAQDGVLRTLAIAHRDPRKVELAEEFQRRYPTDPKSDAGNYGVLRSGRSMLIPDVTDEMLVGAAIDEEHLSMLRQLALHSVLTVPLTARGRTFGTISWVNGEEGRRFSEADIAFGEDIARRAAVAIDNAHLHSELREIAERLQQAVLPPDLPETPGWQLAASYVSAGRVGVGGDFYDVIPLSDHRLALVIGDVMGRGVEAAAAMSQIRAALRALVAVDPDPQAVMTRLDLLYEHFPSEQLVTVLYAVVDPATDQAVIACAGHPPPLLLHPDGTAEFVDLAVGRILGVEPSERTPVTVDFGGGSTLMLFTDGLVERRGEDLEAGKQRLLAAARGLAPTLGSSDLDALVSVMRDPTRDDDVAVLAARRLPERPRA
ncbi:MAG: Serine phosphatase RsbU, regulator of sigma subunit [uncultured Nocardioidaceae bacterium]|uniref:Serine phosphatase RsbU, regulator of sigma subunit n=1 Tax=uncultured Nocardioidaceae bacterium TaxID=253824 RepID=A0A6J4L212_9ACTN|nr:MAG: Serine phosphatase RsbU, regulator of sigma subunit [uncultured Nocardioidaceae bacterium]